MIRKILLSATIVLFALPAQADEFWRCSLTPKGGKEFALHHKALMQEGGRFGGPIYAVVEDNDFALVAVFAAGLEWQLVSIDRKTGAFIETFGGRGEAGRHREQHGICARVRHLD